MRLYWEFFKNSFQSQLVYRANTILIFVGRIIILFIQVAIWRALLQHGDGVSIGTTVITFRDMSTYTIISSALGIFITRDVIWIVDRRIRTGQIAMDLIKPVNLMAQILAQVIGLNGSKVFLELMPLLIIGAVGFGLTAPTLQNGLFVLIAVINAFFINHLLCYIFGLTGFWSKRVRHFDTVLRVLFQVFSGSFIPLWFFPKELADLALALPFRLVYYTPIAIYMGKVNRFDLGWEIALQFMWIAIFWLVSRLIWRRAIHKLVIQGG